MPYNSNTLFQKMPDKVSFFYAQISKKWLELSLKKFSSYIFKNNGESETVLYLTNGRKEADKDLNILALFTLLPLMGFLAFQEPIINFSRSPGHSLWIRLIVLALCQFSVAGLGTSAVLIRLKESIQKYGLVKKKFFPTILQTVHFPHRFRSGSFLSSFSIHPPNKRSLIQSLPNQFRGLSSHFSYLGILGGL